MEVSNLLRPHQFLLRASFIPFAHRGGTSEAPENTLRAFKSAHELGFLYLETDVHSSTDGVLFAFHDNDLNRTCGVDKRIEELHSREISKFLVNGTDPIPTLGDLLEEFPNAMFNIDCKADPALQPLIRDLKKPGVLDRVCIGSFSDRRLRAIRDEFGARVCTSAGPREVTAMTLGAISATAGENGPNCLQIPVKQGPINLASKRFINRCRKAGLPVHYWTIDDPILIHDLIDRGADGIMTDQPAILKTALVSRDLWPH